MPPTRSNVLPASADENRMKWSLWSSLPLMGRPLMGSSLLSTRASAHTLPDRACHSHVSPPKKPYLLLKSFGTHLPDLPHVLPPSFDRHIRYGPSPPS